MIVDNFVDNTLLTAGNASNDAGFNKLPKTCAEIIPFKINGLKKSI
jgi:hypothetical protein